MPLRTSLRLKLPEGFLLDVAPVCHVVAAPKPRSFTNGLRKKSRTSSVRITAAIILLYPCRQQPSERRFKRTAELTRAGTAHLEPWVFTPARKELRMKRTRTRKGFTLVELL